MMGYYNDLDIRIHEAGITPEELLVEMKLKLNTDQLTIQDIDTDKVLVDCGGVSQWIPWLGSRV